MRYRIESTTSDLVLAPIGGWEWSVTLGDEHLGTITYECEMPDWDEEEMERIVRRDYHVPKDAVPRVDA